MLLFANSTKQLNFLCKWYTKIRSAIAHAYWLFVSPIVRPHSTFISPNQPVLEGSNVTLTCTTTAKPHASVTWTNIYTSILSLEVSGKITLLNSSYSVNGGRVQTVSSLMINSMMNSDVKSYICGASNRFGLEEVKTTITIHCKWLINRSFYSAWNNILKYCFYLKSLWNYQWECFYRFNLIDRKEDI